MYELNNKESVETLLGNLYNFLTWKRRNLKNVRDVGLLLTALHVRKIVNSALFSGKIGKSF